MSIQVTTSDWNALLENDYVQGKIVNAVNMATVFKSKLRRVGMTHGLARVYALQYGVAQGNGARAENADLPGYGAGTYGNVTVQAKYNYARGYITGQSEEFSTAKAFVDFGTKFVKDITDGFTLNIARQCWGDGSGTLCLVNNGGGYAAGTTTVSVDSAYGVPWGSFSTNHTRLIKKDMKVQFGTEDNGGAGYKVTAVTATGFTFTPGLANAIADNDRVYKVGSKDAEIEGWLKMVGTSSFMTGVLGLANDTYHGVDRSDVPEWEGNVIDAGAALSEDNIRAAKDTLFNRMSWEAELCIASTQVIRDYEALLRARMNIIQTTKLEGGYTAINHDGLPWTRDKDAYAKAYSLVSPSAIAWAQTGDPNWIKDSGNILRVVEGKDAKSAAYRWYSNLDCDEPFKQLLVYNLTVAA